jgi:hypothetical protein
MALQNLHPRFKSGRRLQISSSNATNGAPAAQSDASQLDYGGLQLVERHVVASPQLTVCESFRRSRVGRGRRFIGPAPEAQPSRRKLAYKALERLSRIVGILDRLGRECRLERATSRSSHSDRERGGGFCGSSPASSRSSVSRGGLLMPQRDQRIDRRRPDGRKQHGECSGDGEDTHDAGVGAEVPRAGLVQQSGE